MTASATLLFGCVASSLDDRSSSDDEQTAASTLSPECKREIRDFSQVQAGPPLTIWLSDSVTAAERRAISAVVRSSPAARVVTYVDERRLFEEARESLKDTPGVGGSLNDASARQYFTVGIEPGERTKLPTLQSKLASMPGVERVDGAMSAEEAVEYLVPLAESGSFGDDCTALNNPTGPTADVT